jgi:hypothetical protein
MVRVLLAASLVSLPAMALDRASSFLRRALRAP